MDSVQQFKDVRATLSQIIIQNRCSLNAISTTPKDYPFALKMKFWDLQNLKLYTDNPTLPLYIKIYLSQEKKDYLLEEWAILYDRPVYKVDSLTKAGDLGKTKLMLLVRYASVLVRLLPCYGLHKNRNCSLQYKPSQASSDAEFGSQGLAFTVKEPVVIVTDQGTLTFRVKHCINPSELISKASIPDRIMFDYQGTTSPINIPVKTKLNSSSESHSAPTNRYEESELCKDVVPRSVPVSIPGSQDKWTKVGTNSSALPNKADEEEDFHIETPASSSFQSKKDGLLKLSISPFRDSGLQQSKSASPVMPVLSSSPSSALYLTPPLPLSVEEDSILSQQTFRNLLDNPPALDFMSGTTTLTSSELYSDVSDT